MSDFIAFCDKDNGMCGFMIFSNLAVIVTKAEHVRKVTSSLIVLNLKVFHLFAHRREIPTAKKHMDNFLGPNSLVSLYDSRWTFHRKLMFKALQYSKYPLFVDVISTTTAKLVDGLRTNYQRKPIDMLPFFKMVTFDVIGKVAFGYDFESTKDITKGLNDVAKAFEFLLEEQSRRSYTINPFSMFYSLPTPSNFKHRAARSLVRSKIEEMIRLRRSGQVARNEADEDFLYRMMDAKDERGVGLNDEELTDEIMTIMFGGFDTTSLTLTYAAALLGLHPAKQERLFEELKQLPPRDLKHEDMPALTYCNCVVKEALRMFPPAPLTVRAADSDLDLDGIKIPAGTDIWIPIACIQRDPTSWADPDDFVPERFENERDIPKGSFIPFSLGDRNCIGQKFALLEATVALATFSRAFHITAVTADVKTAMAGVIQRPVPPFLVSLEARK